MRAGHGKTIAPSRSGFTLVELVLTVVLLLLLLGAVVFNFGSLQSRADLDEGGRQVEALLHFARAQSLASGRKIQIHIQIEGNSPIAADTSTPAASPPATSNSSSTPPTPSSNDTSTRSLQVSQEEDPIRSPNLYTALPGADTFLQAIRDRVAIREIKIISPDIMPPSAPAPITLSDENGSFDARILPGGKIQLPQDSIRKEMNQAREPDPDPIITFYPDGTSDDAELVIASNATEDGRLLRLRLRGMAGTIQRSIESPPPTELESATESEIKKP